jgi:hypothetical protein
MCANAAVSEVLPVPPFPLMTMISGIDLILC